MKSQSEMADEEFEAWLKSEYLKSDLLRLAAATTDFGASVAQAARVMGKFADALAPLEEWPDVVLEDILDAEYIADQNSV